jgi:small subunit ribosomal protein S1
MENNQENNIKSEEETTGKGPEIPESQAGQDAKSNPSMNEVYEESMKDKEAGKIVKGTIVRMKDHDVYVDIGYKSEGIIAKEEFVNISGELKAKVGDEINVFIEKQEDKEGNVVLSKKKADRGKIWDILIDSFEKQEIIEARIIKQVKGGYLCSVGTQAFLPASQAGFQYPKDGAAEIPHEMLKVKIIKFDKKSSNVVVSHRVVLEEEKKKSRNELVKILNAGEIRKGTVKSLADFGAFIDIGGADGLLHISDISWKRISHPSEVLKIGEEKEVIVLNVDKETGRISLGLKQLMPDPWKTFEEKFKEGTVVKGKINHMTNYGIFVDIGEGIEGLVHLSEISWSHRISEPSKLYTVGQEVDVMVLKVDKNAKRISLGVKQLLPNPWEKGTENLSVGSIISGTVTSVTDYGAFIEIAEGVDGLIHNADISWNSRTKPAKDFFKIRAQVDAIILSIDRDKKRISLGLKQLHPDPWSVIPIKYKVGDVINGKISRITNFGAFVEIEQGIEGLLHISQVSTKRVEKIEEMLSVGEEKKMKIIKIVPEERKISLSIRKLLKDLEKEKNPETMNDISLGAMPEFKIDNGETSKNS